VACPAPLYMQSHSQSACSLRGYSNCKEQRKGRERSNMNNERAVVSLYQLKISVKKFIVYFSRIGPTQCINNVCRFLSVCYNSNMLNWRLIHAHNTYFGHSGLVRLTAKKYVQAATKHCARYPNVIVSQPKLPVTKFEWAHFASLTLYNRQQTLSDVLTASSKPQSFNFAGDVIQIS
jgi:hypothetical protein